ncbi:MAG: DciA family protein [Pseudomonadota bacterium]
MSKPRPLSDLVPGLAKGILGRKGLLFGKLVMEWPHIVGPEMAARTVPTELRFAGKSDQKSHAVLHLSVQSAFALEISYQKALLIERLNMFFGYPAIKDIKIIQQTNVMSNKKKTSASIRPLTPKEEHALDGMVAEIQENDLQTALKNLGKAILSRQTDKNMGIVKK